VTTRYRNSVVGLVDILGVSERLSDPGAAERYAEAVAAILRPEWPWTTIHPSFSAWAAHWRAKVSEDE